ncbi:MAG: YtxH domain-containing protein [Pedobacter sp.]|nr:YtxH domain-containing protein [Pedobacter sp.]
MGLIKTALIGAAVYGAIKYITKKDQLTGRSIVDDLKDKTPEWIDKAKGYKQDLESRYTNFANEYPE